MVSGNILITFGRFENILITLVRFGKHHDHIQKTNDSLNKFQMFPLGMWWKHFENVVGQISNDCQLLWGIKCIAHVNITFKMFHKCTHIMCSTWNLQEHLECTQSVIGG